MTVFRLKLAVTAAGMTALFALPAAAQTPPTPPPPAQFAAPPAPIKIEPCPAPEKQPPADSPVLTRCIEVVAHPVNETIIDASTYQFNIRTQSSISGKDQWVPFKETSLVTDFNNLWKTGFLDNLWVETIDEPYDNGVMGKHVIFHIEERPRIKVVDYQPANLKQKMKVEVSKIEEKLTERQVQVRLDSFLDESTIRKVKGVIRELYAEQGYNDAAITTSLTDVPGGPKLVHLTFTIDQGPKVQIREVVFDGNQAFKDGKLRGQIKENKPRGIFSFISGGGTYQEAKFPDDADKIHEFYQNEGYARAQIGTPQIEVMEDSKDGTKRYIRLRIPVDEGDKYKIGKFDIAGDTTVKHEAIRLLFKIQEGDDYSAKKIRKGIDKAREIYGTFGFYQWAPDVEAFPRGIDRQTGEPIDGGTKPPPIMDITLKMVEGKQFSVNRITFLGNTTTHDSVIRREMRVYEGGLFNTEALKESVRRLNQIGYFKPFEGKEGEMDVTPTPGVDNKVDIKLKFEEQNRNQLSFGAGVSQFDGFFGQLSFQTSNFLGRGETVGVSLQRGSQARQYQLSFTEPYLFDRPVTAGFDLFTRQYIFPFQYTQESTGGNTIFGFPLADYTRLFMGYSYERVRVFDINPAYLDPAVLRQSPYLADALLQNQNGHRIVSKVSPSVIFNTINQPIFPSKGTRYTASTDIAGVGGNTNYIQTRLEGIWYVPLSLRTSLGLRAQAQYIRPYGSTQTLPIFEKIFSGGEYTVRGFDIRSIGPRDPVSGVVTGGNKEMVFNAEYYINLFGPVRVLAFFDAGQVRDIGDGFEWKEDITATVSPELPPLFDPFVPPNTLTAPGAIQKVVIGQTHAFKTSMGGELRFFMPVLNVPFRLIAAYNGSRFGVLNNNLRPTPKFTFRFAVGTTF